MKNVADGELMKLIAQGQAKAFRELFTRHGSLVLGYSRRMVRELSLAEDISQDVWMKVVRGAEGYRDQGSFRSWLLKIVRNTALNQLRDRDHFSEMTETENLPAVDLHEFEAVFDQQQDLNLVKKIIDELPDTQRAALVMWLTENLSYEELAEELNTTVAAIKSLLFRARQHLSVKLKGAS